MPKSAHARGSSLKLIKFRPKDIPLFGPALLLFANEYRIARRKPDSLHYIPLSKIYQTLGVVGGRRAKVKAIAAIYFTQVTRGNNASGKCSGWKARPTPRVNGLMLKLIDYLLRDNFAYFADLRRVIYTKGNEVEFTLAFKCPNPETAKVIAETLSKTEDDFQQEAA